MKTELLLRFLNVTGIFMLALTFCLDCRFLYPSIILLVAVEQFQLLKIYNLCMSKEEPTKTLNNYFEKTR